MRRFDALRRVSRLFAQLQLIVENRKDAMRGSRNLAAPAAAFLFCLFVATGFGEARAAEPGASAEAPEAEKEPPSEEKLAKPGASAEAEQRPEEAVGSGTDLAKRAQVATWDLDRITARAMIAPELEALAEKLPERRASLAERVKAAKEGIRRSRRTAWVRDIRFSFVEDQQQITAWQAEVDEASATAASDRKRVGELLVFWRRTNDLARASDVSTEVRERIVGAVRSLATLEDPVGTVTRTSRHIGQLGLQFVAKS